MWGYIIGALVACLFLLIILFSGGTKKDKPEYKGPWSNSNLNEVTATPIPTDQNNLVNAILTCNCVKNFYGQCKKNNGRCTLKPGLLKCDKSGCNPIPGLPIIFIPPNR